MITVFNGLIAWLRLHVSSERGQDLVEYAALGGLIAAALVAAVATGVLGDALDAMFGGISDCIDFDSSTGCGGI